MVKVACNFGKEFGRQPCSSERALTSEKHLTNDSGVRVLDTPQCSRGYGNNSFFKSQASNDFALKVHLLGNYTLFLVFINDKSLYITITCLCNILQYFTAVKTIIFK